MHLLFIHFFDFMEEIKSFYNSLPFNFVEDSSIFAQQIKEFNPVHEYIDLHKILGSKKYIFLNPIIKDVLEFGCGTGYLSNSMAYYYQKEVTGVDLSFRALDSAKEVSKHLKTKVNFQLDDLNNYKTNKQFDLVVSNGVLHHTENCFLSFQKISKFVKKGGYLYIGLYHRYSREIMLKFFKSYLNWYGEKSTYNLFKKMNNINKELGESKTYCYSWFKDQILNVYETHHTFKEVYKWSHKVGLKIISTSINNFNYINEHEINLLFELEKKLRKYSYKKNIIENNFYPGYFTVLMKKK